MLIKPVQIYFSFPKTSKKLTNPNFTIYHYNINRLFYVLYKTYFVCHFLDYYATPENFSQVPNFLQEYKRCLANKKFDEAKKTNKEINCLITNEIKTTGWELMSFAEDLVRKADRFEESIPVYFAAASLFKKEGNSVRMSECVGDDEWGEGIHGANMRIVQRDVTMKEVVKYHVIPLMHDVKKQMLEVTSVSEKDKCWAMMLVHEAIAWSEKLVDDDQAAKKALKESRAWEEKRMVEEDTRCVVI